MIASNELRDELKVAIKASIAAGAEIIQVYDAGFDIELKEDQSPITTADRAANETIMSFLNKTDIPIISEENQQVHYQIRKSWTHCWMVDPLDGTKEFIKRNGEFTVNIALLKEKSPEIGVIYIPVTQTLYAADVLKGMAFKVTLSSTDQHLDDILQNAVQITKKHSSQGKVRVLGSRSHRNKQTNDFIQQLRNEGSEIEILGKGSSLKFCLIAEGEADIYPRFAPTMEWDTAAGHAICKVAGCQLINWETKKELTYNKENLLNPWFICK